jgi:glutamate N-acetyltransferase/amino-acid N-acetyltransferase
METYSSQNEYLNAVTSRAVLPAGFQAGVTSLSFFPAEIDRAKEYKMNMALILLERPSPSFHALFTNNLFCGAPVIIGRQRLKEKLCRGIIINNKISNVAAPTGEADQEKVLATLGDTLKENPRSFLPASTGIIGWSLPVTEMCEKIPLLVSNMQKESLLPVARAMMTTDAYPKVRSVRCGDGVIVAAAKGAGMIEPNLATMLVFILTDLTVRRKQLATCLSQAAENTLNRISVDSDQSTSDMAIMLSSNMKPAIDRHTLLGALTEVLGKLAEDIVRNGEGVSHVIKATVTSAPTLELAKRAGKALINSPLVKTALFGNDPNVGRLVSALGDCFGSIGFRLPRRRLTLRLGGIEIFSQDRFQLDGETEVQLQAYLKECAYSLAGHFPPHNRSVEISIDLGTGKEEATVLGADLSYDYVKENASYRS